MIHDNTVKLSIYRQNIYRHQGMFINISDVPINYADDQKQPTDQKKYIYN